MKQQNSFTRAALAIAAFADAVKKLRLRPQKTKKIKRIKR
jgi:hypothetical protein